MTLTLLPGMSYAEEAGLYGEKGCAADYAKEPERHYDDAEDEALYNKWVESLKPMPKVTGDDVKSDTAEPSGEQPDGEQRQDGGDATAARSSDGH